MDHADALASTLGDVQWAAEMLPRACPCSYGADDRYTLLEAIGSGRGSIVYRAIDHRMSSEDRDSLVAIKIRESGADAATEAIYARWVNHANVVHTYDHQIAPDGSSYAVFELIEGRDLARAAVPMPAHAAVRLMIAIADGVAAVHRAGLVHGDLKPENVLLTEDGTPKVADFDLASPDRTDRVGGNLAFAAPELVSGAETRATPPSDVFALGGMLYWLIRGEMPLGQTRSEIRARLFEDAYHPPALGGDRDLALIVQRVMARDPTERHASAEQFCDDLRAWLSHEPIRWTDPGAGRLLWLWARRRPIRTVLVAGSAILLLSGAIGGWAWDRADQARRAEMRETALRLQAEAHRESVRLANEKVERLKAQVRSVIEAFVRSGWGREINASESSILPRMALADWLGSFPIFEEAGARMPVEQRIDRLTGLLDRLERTGQDESIDALLVRYTMAYFLTERRSPERALAHLRAIDEGWRGVLPPDDSLWSCVEGLKVVNRIRTIQRGDEPVPPEIRADLEQARVRLEEAFAGQPVIDIIDSLQTR